MTTDVRDESAKNGAVRRHQTGMVRPVTGVMRAAVTAAEPADLEAMCHHIADLARTRPEPPRRIRVEHLGTALEIEWPERGEKAPAPGPAATAEDPLAPQGDPAVAGDGLRRVCAPMIGTFFHAPEPGAPSFVSVGDTVVPGQQVGILEVMKMMSPVHADVAGTVREILVPDGGSVEFLQALIAVEPAGGR